jgi:predicted RecB family endonuclease
MIGGLSGAATGALRALLDSAHIQNIPTLLKLKGGPGGQTINVQPTEVVEIEGGALVDDIRKLAMALPFNGPSPTLFQLLGFLVDAGKGVVQTSFEKLADQNPNAPVGTTLALIEQGMVVFSSIHSRLHNSMARVFQILHRINSAYLTEEDIEAMENGLDVKPEDFDGPMDVVPVSDPAIFSEAQRFAQVQAVQQRAAAMPQMYDLRKVEEMFLRNLKLSPDDVLQPEPGQDDVDPVSENVAASMGRPIYVLPKQDHVAHIQTHLAFLKSPIFGMNPAIIKTYIYPMAQHLRDHLLNFYLTQAHEAVQRAEREKLISSDAEQQVRVILKVQQIIEQQLANFAQDLAKIDEMAQQFAPQPPQMPQDKSMEIAQLNAQVQQLALNQRAQSDAQRQQIEQAKLVQKQQSDQLALADKQQSRAEDLQREQLRQASENERTAAEIDAKLTMNDADNATAMRLAAAEIASGEKVAVSTGTGINPGTR